MQDGGVMAEDIRLVAGSESSEDRLFDRAVRPRRLDDYVITPPSCIA